MAGFANTPLINNFRYKQSTVVSGNTSCPCLPILSVADGGNGQLVVTTSDTSTLVVATAVTISGTTNYDGNYTVISLTATTFNISGTFIATDTGTWELAFNTSSANAGDPLDFGEISFFDQDNQTVFQTTFSDRELTIPNTNPIILSAVGTAPPIYLQDLPYFIVIKDKFNNLVATLDNYLPEGEEVTPTSELPLENLLPNYGFDTQINENLYGIELAALPTNGTFGLSAGWFWQITTTETSPNNRYSFNVIGASAFPANPKNELVLRSTNNTTGQSINRLYAVIGDYNSFQGLQLQLSIITERISGSTATLACELIRTKNGVEETPISIGSVPIVPTQGQQTLIFSVPALADSNYSNGDELRFVLALPLNEDIEYGLTGTWLQLSPNGDLAISETAGSTDAGKEFFGESFRDLQTVPQYVTRGLPVVIGEGKATVLNSTGAIFMARSGRTFNFAVSMGKFDDTSLGVELVRDEPLGLTQTNRLIDNLRASFGFTQSRLTFAATSAVNVVSVGTGIGTAPNSTWATSAGPRITVTKTVDELIYKVAVLPLGNGKARFTFVDNFNADTVAHNPQYTNAGGDVFSTLPPSGVMIPWLGRSSFTSAASNKNVFDPYVGRTTIATGSVSTPAIVDITFCADNLYTDATVNTDRNDQGNTVGVFMTRTGSPYAGRNSMVRTFTTGGGTSNTNATLYSGFLAYNDVSDNPNPQVFTPPRSIRFDSNGQMGSVVPDGTATVTGLTPSSTPSEVATRISQTVNTSFVHEITIVSTPTNGDVVEISNATTDFNLIFWDDTFAVRPANPSLVRKAIYVKFAPASGTTAIAAVTETAINFGVMGVPRAADVGMPFHLDFYEYFMVL